MQVGDYQISNLLIGAVLFTTVAGLGIATGAAGSVADVVSDTFIPGGNATQAPDTDSGSSETDQNTDTTNSQDSDDGSDPTDSTGSTDSSDSGGSSGSDGGSSDSDSDSTDSTSGQDSETEDQQDNQQQDNQQDNDGNIQTSASITSPSNGQIYNTASVDITATVEAANASYEVRLDDSLKQSGQLDGTKDISSTLSVSDGTHNIKVLVKRSGETLVSKKAQFSVSTSSTNTSGSASISLFEPNSKPYPTNTVRLYVTLDASDASYQVNVDGVTKTSGSVDGSKTLDQDLNIVSGSHNMEVVISDSGGTLASDSVSFTVDTGNTDTQRTGFYSPDNLTAGETTLVRLYNDQGDPVEGGTVTVGSLGDFTTNQFGEIEFQVPFQDTITASSTNHEKTFDITQTATEPDITLIQPTDPTTFDTPTGTSRDVTFEADVDITEDSGSASVIIDGSQAYTQDLSSGTNPISTTQALSGGTHNWQIDVDTPEYNVSSSSRSLTINEVEVQNGLSLQNNATAGESNYVRLYDSGEPVNGEEVTVNGDSIGTTDSDGEVGFEVPNVQEITVSASGYSDITRTVEGYEEVNTPLIYSTSIQNPSSGEVQKPFTFEANVDAGLADSYEIKNSNQVLKSGSLSENSINTITKSISPSNGEQTLEFIVMNSENGNSTTRSISVDVWEMIQITSPSEGESFSTNEIGFSFSLAESLSGDYSILVDGTQKYSDSLGSNTGFSKDLLVADQGSHTATIDVDSGQGSYSRSVGFSVNQDTDTSTTLISPSDGAVIQEPRFTWNTTYPTQYWTYLNIDGSQVAEFERYNDAQISKTADISPGDHTWQTIVEDEKSSEDSISSSTYDFKLVDIVQNSPTGSTASSPVDFSFSIDTGSSTIGKFLVNGLIQKEEQLSTGSNTFSYSLDRSPGMYPYAMVVENEDSGKTAERTGIIEVN